MTVKEKGGWGRSRSLWGKKRSEHGSGIPVNRPTRSAIKRIDKLSRAHASGQISVNLLQHVMNPHPSGSLHSVYPPSITRTPGRAHTLTPCSKSHVLVSCSFSEREKESHIDLRTGNVCLIQRDIVIITQLVYRNFPVINIFLQFLHHILFHLLLHHPVEVLCRSDRNWN